MLKKMIIAASSSVCIALLVSFWIVPAARRAQGSPDPPPSSSAQPISFAAESAEASHPDSLYYLGESHGYVAAFRGGESEPFQVLDTPVSALPSEDQRLLRAGIPANSRAELQRLIEDYS